MVGHDEAPQGIGRFKELHINELKASDGEVDTQFTVKSDITFDDFVDLRFNTGSGSRICSAANQKIGFFGATPTAQLTGVAVSAAGIHAALVTLGLITA